METVPCADASPKIILTLGGGLKKSRKRRADLVNTPVLENENDLKHCRHFLAQGYKSKRVQNTTLNVENVENTAVNVENVENVWARGTARTLEVLGQGQGFFFTRAKSRPSKTQS